MPVADTERVLLITLRHSEDGAPSGTLRVVGRPGETAFDGWIDLIGLITEARSEEMDNAATMRSAYERINGGDLDDYAALVAEDFVEHAEIPGLPATKSGMLEYFGMILAAFPDLHFVVDDVIVGDGKAVARATVTGTHQGEFMGVPATGNRAEIQLIDIMGFGDDGLIHEHWGVADMLSLLQQIGAVPA
jgi:steroid delta-isomerase-like uncharacterized protein